MSVPEHRIPREIPPIQQDVTRVAPPRKDDKDPPSFLRNLVTNVFEKILPPDVVTFLARQVAGIDDYKMTPVQKERLTRQKIASEVPFERPEGMGRFEQFLPSNVRKMEDIREDEIDRLFELKTSGKDVISSRELNFLEQYLPHDVLNELKERTLSSTVGTLLVDPEVGPLSMIEGHGLAKVGMGLVGKLKDAGFVMKVDDLMTDLASDILGDDEALKFLQSILPGEVDTHYLQNLKSLYSHGVKLEDINKATGLEWDIGVSGGIFKHTTPDGKDILIAPPYGGDTGFLISGAPFDRKFDTLDDVKTYLDEIGVIGQVESPYHVMTTHDGKFAVVDKYGKAVPNLPLFYTKEFAETYVKDAAIYSKGLTPTSKHLDIPIGQSVDVAGDFQVIHGEDGKYYVFDKNAFEITSDGHALDTIDEAYDIASNHFGNQQLLKTTAEPGEIITIGPDTWTFGKATIKYNPAESNFDIFNEAGVLQNTVDNFEEAIPIIHKYGMGPGNPYVNKAKSSAFSEVGDILHGQPIPHKGHTLVFNKLNNGWDVLDPFGAKVHTSGTILDAKDYVNKATTPTKVTSIHEPGTLGKQQEDQLIDQLFGEVGDPVPAGSSFKIIKTQSGKYAVVDQDGKMLEATPFYASEAGAQDLLKHANEHGFPVSTYKPLGEPVGNGKLKSISLYDLKMSTGSLWHEADGKAVTFIPDGTKLTVAESTAHAYDYKYIVGVNKKGVTGTKYFKTLDEVDSYLKSLMQPKYQVKKIQGNNGWAIVDETGKKLDNSPIFATEGSAQYHIDNVIGQTTPYQPQFVEDSHGNQILKTDLNQYLEPKIDVKGGWSLFSPQRGLLTGSPSFKTYDEAWEYLEDIRTRVGQTASTSPIPPKKHINSLTADDFINNKVGIQEGSNVGGWYEVTRGPLAGTRVYGKYPPGGDSQVRTEHLGNLIYNKYGMRRAPETSVVETEDGLMHISKDMGDEWKGNNTINNFTQAQARQVLEDFYIDIILGNWDVVSYNFDNILLNTNGVDIIKVDQGGSLLHKAAQGRKPEAALNTIAEDWDKFPTTAGYGKVMKRAGYDTFDEFVADNPNVLNKIERLPEDWSKFVNDTYPDWIDEDKTKVINMLNNRTRELKLRVSNIPDRNIQNKIDDAIADNVSGYINPDWPLWHKLLKVDGSSGGLGDHFATIAKLDPDFKELRSALGSWTGSSHEMRGTIARLLDIGRDRYNIYEPSIEGAARLLINAISDETPNAPDLFRGIRGSDGMAKYGHLRVGDITDMIPASFSATERTGHSFAEFVIFKLEPNSKSLRISNISSHPESEWITGGVMEVIGVEDVTSHNKNIREITIRQREAYSVPNR